MKKIFYALLLLLALGLCACGPDAAKPAASVTTSKMLLHTVVTLQLDGGDAAGAAAEIWTRLETIEALTDPGRPESDIARLNAAAGSPVPVSPEVFHLLAAAQALSEQTDGAFDITLLPVSRLYAFGTEQPRVPDTDTLKTALAHTGHQKLLLNHAERTACLTDREAAVDLGAVVKGYAADEVRRILQAHGVTHALCSFGTSTVLALGTKEDGTPWRIGLKHPRQEKAVAGTLALQQQVLSVSGDYERCFLQDGVRYHHLLDPQSGLPAREVQAAAVVLDADTPDAGLYSDMLSTACFVLGQEKTEQLAQSCPVKFQYVFVDQQSRVMAP